jgi:hypothetical protein
MSYLIRGRAIGISVAFTIVLPYGAKGRVS